MDQSCVLVTGGAGYIGSHVCKALSARGITPVTYDSLVTGHKDAVKWGPLEVGDTRDPERLSEVMKKYSPAAVAHFAAFIAVGESVDKPGLYYDNNIGGSLCLVSQMVEHGIGKLVFSSTAAVYGEPQSSSISESHPRNPINPYGFSKHAVEQILADFAVAHRLRSVSLRYFNAAGADPEGETGEAHEPETHLIPLVLDAASGKRDKVLIFGDDYDTPDGTCIRDYIHVCDLAAAHVKALDYMDDHEGAAAFNLGNGNGFSVRQIIEAACDVTGVDIPTEIAPKRAGDSAVLVADITKGKAGLGWEPEFTDVRDQIAHAWNWHQRQ